MTVSSAADAEHHGLTPFAACSPAEAILDSGRQARRKLLMTRSGLFLICVFTVFSVPKALAQEELAHHAEVYALASSWGGQDIPGGGPAAGFRIGGAWRPSPEVSLVGDFSRHFVSDRHASFTTLMAGPRLHSGEQYRMSGFVQVLTGSQRSALNGASGQQVGWNYVLAPGAGVDIRLTDRLVFRPLEVDLTLTRGPGILRVSSGFAFRFGN